MQHIAVVFKKKTIERCFLGKRSTEDSAPKNTKTATDILPILVEVVVVLRAKVELALTQVVVEHAHCSSALALTNQRCTRRRQNVCQARPFPSKIQGLRKNSPCAWYLRALCCTEPDEGHAVLVRALCGFVTVI